MRLSNGRAGTISSRGPHGPKLVGSRSQDDVQTRSHECPSRAGGNEVNSVFRVRRLRVTKRYLDDMALDIVAEASPFLLLMKCASISTCVSLHYTLVTHKVQRANLSSSPLLYGKSTT